MMPVGDPLPGAFIPPPPPPLDDELMNELPGPSWPKQPPLDVKPEETPSEKERSRIKERTPTLSPPRETDVKPPAIKKPCAANHGVQGSAQLRLDEQGLAVGLPAPATVEVEGTGVPVGAAVPVVVENPTQ